MPSTGPQGYDLAFAVVDSVSAAENATPTELPPLYETIDPDALNALFAGRGATTGSVVFQYHGYTVAVASDGRVCLEPIQP